MKLSNEDHSLFVEAGATEVSVVAMRKDKIVSIDMTVSDMRRLARFILDEVKEDAK
jgi:hypothetical protein